MALLTTAGILFAVKRGFYFVSDNWRSFAALAGMLFLMLLIVWGFRACRSQPKLNEAEIKKAEIAIQERNREALKEILAESDVRLQGIDNSIKAAEEATRQAKKNYEGMSDAQLAAELERRK